MERSSFSVNSKIIERLRPKSSSFGSCLIAAFFAASASTASAIEMVSRTEWDEIPNKVTCLSPDSISVDKVTCAFIAANRAIERNGLACFSMKVTDESKEEKVLDFVAEYRLNSNCQYQASIILSRNESQNEVVVNEIFKIIYKPLKDAVCSHKKSNAHGLSVHK